MQENPRPSKARDDSRICLVIGANAADFALDPGSTCPLGGGGRLMPGDTCSVGIIFSPSDTGTRTAQINVDDDAPGSPQTISLVGTGTI